SGLAEGVAARALLARPACDERARAGAGASLPPSARQWRRGRSRGREEEEEEEDEERWNRAARAPGVGPRGCLCSRRQPALPCGPPRNHYGDGDEPGKLHDSADCGQSAPQLPLVGGAHGGRAARVGSLSRLTGLRPPGEALGACSEATLGLLGRPGGLLRGLAAC
ncbi:unnamed protein product, partial [Prorocentrum cordatum]